MVAPLRAMGSGQRIQAVDLDGSGWRLFKRTCGEWASPVNFNLGEACRWLGARKEACDLIIEDLSIVEQGDVYKPAITWSTLPGLIRRRLSRAGVAIHNLLPPKNARWAAAFHHVIDPRRACRVVEFADFENRLLIVARRLPTARQLSVAMGQQLRAIGSRQAGRISVRAACASRPDIPRTSAPIQPESAGLSSALRDR
jgi:hypothetical protein